MFVSFVFRVLVRININKNNILPQQDYDFLNVKNYPDWGSFIKTGCGGWI